MAAESHMTSFNQSNCIIPSKRSSYLCSSKICLWHQCLVKLLPKLFLPNWFSASRIDGHSMAGRYLKLINFWTRFCLETISYEWNIPSCRILIGWLQCDKIWQNLDNLAKFKAMTKNVRVYFVLAKVYYLLWQFFAIGPIFSALNGQTLNK